MEQLEIFSGYQYDIEKKFNKWTKEHPNINIIKRKLVNDRSTLYLLVFYTQPENMQTATQW